MIDDHALSELEAQWLAHLENDGDFESFARQHGYPSYSSIPEPLVEAANWPVPGDTVAGYSLIEEIGRSSISRVFLAHTERVERQVVVKVSICDSSEPEILGALGDHDHVVDAHSGKNLGGDIPLYAVVMDWMPGKTIADLVDDKGPLPTRHVVRQFVGLTDALAFAVEQHIVHQDVKPANVLWCDDGKARWIDFNLASDERHLVRTAGTVGYMSPESLAAFLGHRVVDDPHGGDVFGVAATMYFAITGKPPWPIPNGMTSPEEAAEYVAAEQSKPLTPIRDIRRDVDPSTASVIEQQLSFDPSARPAKTARDFQLQLQQSLGVRARARGAIVRHPLSSAATCTALLLIGLVLAWSWWNMPSEEVRWRTAAAKAVAADDLESAEKYLHQLANRGRTGVAASRPTNPDANYGYGLALLKLQKGIEARAPLQLASTTHYRDPFLFRCLAYASLESKQNGIATDCYEKLLSEHDENPVDLANYGRMLTTMSVYELRGASPEESEAHGQKMLERAVELRPDLREAWCALAALERKRYERARNDYRPDGRYLQALLELYGDPDAFTDLPHCSRVLTLAALHHLALAKQAADPASRSRHLVKVAFFARRLAEIDMPHSPISALIDSVQDLPSADAHYPAWEEIRRIKPTQQDTPLGPYINPMDDVSLSVALKDVIDWE